MAHKKVLNKKQDFWEYKRTNRQLDFEVLKIAKDQEGKKCLQAVKSGSKTIILKEVGVRGGKKKKRIKTK